MSLPAVGIYMRLICQCWIEGSLPDDAKILARISGATARQFRNLWPSIATCFRRNTDGRWTHPRLDREREKQQTHRQRQSDRATARWEMTRKLEQNRESTDAAALPRHKSTSSSAMQALQCSSSSSAFASEKQESGAPTRTPDRSPTRTSAPLIAQSAHRNHAYCGVVCLPAAMCDDFIARSRHRPDPQAYVSAFFDTWNARYFSGDRKDIDISGDAFDFWRKRWKETHPETEQKAVVDIAAKALERINADKARYGR
jgi:uncharacterized protein YdaU (DUF1376 family)